MVCLRTLSVEVTVKDIYFQLKVFDKMSSLRQIRELLADCYMDGVISDEEFVLLYDENRSKKKI